MKKGFTKKMYINRGWSERCPNCKKKIILKNKMKSIVRCSKCSNFTLFIRGRNRDEIFDLIRPEEGRFFDYEIKEYEYNDYVLKGVFNIKDSHLLEFKNKSKVAGLALEKYLDSGNKKLLTPKEQNILYKLKAESINEIEKEIQDKLSYLRAKIECIKLLKILDY